MSEIIHFATLDLRICGHCPPFTAEPIAEPQLFDHVVANFLAAALPLIIGARTPKRSMTVAGVEVATWTPGCFFLGVNT